MESISISPTFTSGCLGSVAAATVPAKGHTLSNRLKCSRAKILRLSDIVSLSKFEKSVEGFATPAGQTTEFHNLFKIAFRSFASPLDVISL